MLIYHKLIIWPLLQSSKPIFNFQVNQFLNFNIRKRNCHIMKSLALNSDPVLAAQHITYCLEVFFTEIVIGSPLAKNKYVISEEFQFWSSPHILFSGDFQYTLFDCKKQGRKHCFFDSIVNAFLPDKNEKPELNYIN